MQDIVVSNPFNRENFIESQKNLWFLSSRPKFNLNITYTVVALFITIMGTLYEDKSMPLLTLISGGYFFYMVFHWIGYIERRIKFFRQTSHYAAAYQEMQLICTYTVSEAGIEYLDNEKNIKLSWHLIKTPFFFKKYLVIPTVTPGIIFILSKKETDDIICQEIYNLAIEKVRVFED